MPSIKNKSQTSYRLPSLTRSKSSAYNSASLVVLLTQRSLVSFSNAQQKPETKLASYTAFGEVTIYNDNGQLLNTSTIDNTILWNTRRKDEVSGYCMYKYRHYAPELGRWPSRDPIEEKGGVNLYAFVESVLLI